MSLKRICVRKEELKCPKIPHCPKIPVMTLVNSYLSQLLPIFGQLIPDLWSTRTYPKSTRTRVSKRGRVEHDRRGVGKSRS